MAARTSSAATKTARARVETRSKESESRNQALVRRLAEIVAQRDWTLVQAGRSLHDDLGQVLTVAGIRFDLLATECAPRYPEIAKELETIQGLLAECQARTRILSSQMNRSTVDRVGLRSALERVRDRWEPGFAGVLSLECPSNVRPRASVSRAIVDLTEYAMELASNRLSCTRAATEVSGGEASTAVEIFLDGVTDPLAEIEDEVRWYVVRGASHLAAGHATIDIVTGRRNGTVLRSHFGVLPKAIG